MNSCNQNNLSRIYEPPRVSIILLEKPDIITASPTSSENVTQSGWTSGDW